MENDDYIPIDCGLYSEYELAIMHRERLRLTWRDPAGETHMASVMPTDLRTFAGAEYLCVTRLDGERFEIRLDRILRFSRT